MVTVNGSKTFDNNFSSIVIHSVTILCIAVVSCFFLVHNVVMTRLRDSVMCCLVYNNVFNTFEHGDRNRLF